LNAFDAVRARSRELGDEPAEALPGDIDDFTAHEILLNFLFLNRVAKCWP
jgi:hypothetical protein